jgi:hypothetical protein
MESMIMKETHQQKNSISKKKYCYRDGRFYFTKEAERSFYFILTLIMLAAGVLYKTGIL